MLPRGQRALWSIVFLAGLVLTACSSGAPAPATTAAKPAESKPPAEAKPAAGQSAQSATIDQLIEGARKEGPLRINYPSPLGPEGQKRLVEAFNKKFGLKTEVNFSEPGSQMPAIATQVMVELKTGLTPSWDVITARPSMAVFSEMKRSDMLVTYDWAATFPWIPKEMLELDNAYVGVQGFYYLPAYNSKLVKPEDAPKKWEDLLDPRWKGKLGGYNQVEPWIQLAEVWGEERTDKFVEGLAQQQPLLVGVPQLLTRIGSGEYPIAVTTDLMLLFSEQKKGAPIKEASEVDPILASSMGSVVIQKAVSPNTAKLWAAFLLTPEAQEIVWDLTRKGAPTQPDVAKWLKGKVLFHPTVDFAIKEGPRLEEKYRKMLGLK